MDFLVRSTLNGYRALPTKVIDPSKLRKALSPLSLQILRLLAEEPMYPKLIAKRLNVIEQKVYYHMKNLEEAGLIKVAFTEQKRGIEARYYTIDKPAFTIAFREASEILRLPLMPPEYEEFFYPFIDNARLNCLFVVGSPEHHGELMARSKDLPLLVELAMFFARFVNEFKHGCVKLDTELEPHELEQHNLVLVGGPAVNSVVAKVNKHLPVKFLSKQNFYRYVFSKPSHKLYKGEDIGIIVKTKSPFDPEHFILLLAGRRFIGTQASVLALIKNTTEAITTNLKDGKTHAKVVRGVDADGDGKVDRVYFLE